jgi:hypothetical protein
MEKAGWAGWLAGVAMVVVTGAAGWAQTADHAVQRTDQITLRVYDYVGADKVHADVAGLAKAETEAGAILARAGVSVRWVGCPTSHAVINDFPACASAQQPTDVVVSILPHAMAGRAGASGDALGSADEMGNGSRRAAIFYDRVSAMAGGDTAPMATLLARVMAHELGHLLLGENAHSRTGIMRGAWGERELSGEAGGEMVFTPEQARRMQSRLAAQALETTAAAAEIARSDN